MAKIPCSKASEDFEAIVEQKKDQLCATPIEEGKIK